MPDHHVGESESRNCKKIKNDEDNGNRVGSAKGEKPNYGKLLINATCREARKVRANNFRCNDSCCGSDSDIGMHSSKVVNSSSFRGSKKIIMYWGTPKVVETRKTPLINVEK